MTDNVRNPFSRLFVIEDRAGPSHAPLYLSYGRAQGPSQDFGSVTPVREPDPDRYGAFRVVDIIRGEPGLPTLPLEIRYQFTLSEMLRLARKGCALDLHVHMGKCQNASDFDGGWEKFLVIEGAIITSWNPDGLGALNQGDDAVINESVDTTGLDMYEVKKMALSEIGAAQVTREMVDIVICDSVSCGACGIPSDGCRTFFALSVTTTGSPGLAADIQYSSDGGTTVVETNVSTLGAQDADALACVGIYLVVVSEDDVALHYAPIADIIAGTETWVRVATGFINGPRDIFSLGARFTWIVGGGGYVYFSTDVTAGVDVQDAGSATVEDLNAIHGVDELNLVAVGANNAVLHTINGGATWEAITGPAVGIVLNTVFMASKDVWWIGTANGRLWYTLDGGANWTEKAFAGSGDGQVRDIVFPTPTVGYMAHDTSLVVGRILRTINGGYSWYVAPEEGAGSIPTNDKINAVAACGENVNVLYAAGLGANGVDGIMVKGA